MILKTLFLIITILLISTPSAHGQSGSLDLTFAQTGIGLSNNVFTLAIQPDGKILAGGAFLSYNGTSRQRLARLNTDGTLDNTFAQTGSGINAGVRAVLLQSDGKILVGGDFTAYNGITCNYVTRLNADGTLDASFTPTGTGVNSTVYDFSVLNDGRILLIGSFTSYNGTNRSRILRLNADGTLDATFNQTGTGINNDIYSISVQPDGKILIGGNFTDYNGIQRNNIARLNADGTLDNSFSQTGTGLNNQVFTIAIQQDGKILAGGSFSGYNGTAQNSIVRLNSDGTLDQTFSQTGIGLNNPVRRRGIIVLKDGKILIGGDFTAYNGITQNSLARLNSNAN